MGRSHPLASFCAPAASRLLVVGIGLAAALLARAQDASQQSCPGLGLRPVGTVAMAVAAGGAGTCSERGSDPVRVEAVRGQTLELTSALNLRLHERLQLSMIHWYNSHGAPPLRPTNSTPPLPSAHIALQHCTL